MGYSNYLSGQGVDPIDLWRRAWAAVNARSSMVAAQSLLRVEATTIGVWWGVDLGQVKAVNVEISVVLGRSVLPMQQLLRMGRGAVIPLDAKTTDEVWIWPTTTRSRAVRYKSMMSVSPSP